MDPSILFSGGVIGLVGVAMIAVGGVLVYTDVFRTNPWSVVLVAATIVWMVGESMGLLEIDPSRAILWSTAKYGGLAFVGPAWFGVAARFSARSFWVGPRGTVILLASGAAFALAVATEPWHGLLSVSGIARGNGRLLSSGPLWYALIAFTFAYLIGGLVLVRRMVVRFPRIIQRRGALLVVVVALPTAIGFLDLFPTPIPSTVPLVPLTVALSALVLIYGFFRLHFMSPIKLASAAVIDMLTDPVVVIDENLRIALVNPAGRRISEPAQPAVPGMRVDDAFPGLEGIAQTEGVNVESGWVFRGREYLVRTTFVENPRTLTRAVVATLTDVTALREEQERLELIVEERTLELKRINEELEESVARHEVSERKLHAALADKDMLLKEIHHRVKNNLQIVASLISLQAGRIADAEARASYAAVTRRIKAISLVHERIYHSASFKQVSLGRYVKELASAIASAVSDGNIPITLEVEETALEVTPDACVDIGLILNEVLTNALKHGIIPAGAGSITVRLAQVDDSVTIRVSDTGPGFASADVDESRSLGMTVVRAIASKYRASISCTNDGGAVVTIVFPAKKILAPSDDQDTEAAIVSPSSASGAST